MRRPTYWHWWRRPRLEWATAWLCRRRICRARRRGAAGTVSLLNFAWCIGAVACSPLVLLALRNHLLSAFLWIVAFGAFVLAVCFLFVSFPEAHARPAAATLYKPARAPALGVTIAVSVLFFIYV